MSLNAIYLCDFSRLQLSTCSADQRLSYGGLLFHHMSWIEITVARWSWRGHFLWCRISDWKFEFLPYPHLLLNTVCIWILRPLQILKLWLRTCCLRLTCEFYLRFWRHRRFPCTWKDDFRAHCRDSNYAHLWLPTRLLRPIWYHILDSRRRTDYFLILIQIIHESCLLTISVRCLRRWKHNMIARFLPLHSKTHQISQLLTFWFLTRLLRASLNSTSTQ